MASPAGRFELIRAASLLTRYHSLANMINMSNNMRRATRLAKSFTIDERIHTYILRTRGRNSASERVNELLQRAILDEQYEALDREAASFFAELMPQERAESRAFGRASLRTLRRD